MTRPLQGRALRDTIEAVLRANPPDKKRRIQLLKAKAVEDAWQAHPGRTERGLGVGDVWITSMRTKMADDGTVVLEVHVDDPANQEPHYCVINPPSLVRDASGEIELAGKRFREDPVAAVAALIARTGGTVKASQRGRVRR